MVWGLQSGAPRVLTPAPTGSASSNDRPSFLAGKIVPVKVAHFYSPLRDPPAVPGPEDISRWREEFRAKLMEHFVPDLAGPSLASIYASKAKAADNGNIEAAAALFKGLYYCRKEDWGYLATQAQLDSTITHMRQTQTDRWGAPTDDAAQAVEHARAQYRYCAGVRSAEGSNRSDITSWAPLAFRSGDPDVELVAAFFTDGVNLGAMSPDQIITKRQEITNHYARLGVPFAWQLNMKRIPSMRRESPRSRMRTCILSTC